MPVKGYKCAQSSKYHVANVYEVDHDDSLYWFEVSHHFNCYYCIDAIMEISECKNWHLYYYDVYRMLICSS